MTKSKAKMSKTSEYKGNPGDGHIWKVGADGNPEAECGYVPASSPILTDDGEDTGFTTIEHAELTGNNCVLCTEAVEGKKAGKDEEE